MSRSRVPSLNHFKVKLNSGAGLWPSPVLERLALFLAAAPDAFLGLCAQEAAGDGPGSWVTATHTETGTEFQLLGLVLAIVDIRGVNQHMEVLSLK